MTPEEELLHFHELNNRWKELSWLIYNEARRLFNEDISHARFRESVREMLEKYTEGPKDPDNPTQNQANKD
jgi:hypothetical protein